MKGVAAVVVLSFECLTADGVLGAADAVHIATWNGVVDWMAGILGCRNSQSPATWLLSLVGSLTVVVNIIVAQDYIDVVAVFVFDK